MGDHIILPPIEQEWLLAQATEDLDQTANLNNEFQGETLFGGPFALHSRRIRETIVKDLDKNLARSMPPMFKEIARGIDKLWGVEGLKEVSLMFSLLEVIAKASNRVFIGSNLSNNSRFIRNSLYFAATLAPCSISIRQVPRPLRRFLVPLITAFNGYCRRSIYQEIEAEVRQRLNGAVSITELCEKSSVLKQNDFLQWLIDSAYTSGDPVDLDPHKITQRIVILQFRKYQTLIVDKADD